MGEVELLGRNAMGSMDEVPTLARGFVLGSTEGFHDGTFLRGFAQQPVRLLQVIQLNDTTYNK